MDLSVSIVNYNGCKLLEQCLTSIYEETEGISFEVFVVDNASADGSVEMVKSRFPQVNLIVNKKNLFFTKAHNKALKTSKGEYVCILNNDTIILDNAFNKMLKFMNKHPEAGACGPQLLNPDMTIQHSCDRFPTFVYGLYGASLLNTIFPNNPVRKNHMYSDWDHNSLRTVDFVSGSCIVFRRETIKQVGLLDEKFLIYWEETDLCYRIINSGWKIYYLPDAKLIHYWGKDMKKHGRKKVDRIFNNSMIYYYRKHYGYLASLVIKLILTVTVQIVTLTRFAKSIIKG